MELSTAQTAILTFLRHYMSNLEYQYYESKNDFMRSYPYSVPYTAPRPEPMSYPDDDEFPLWAKQICYINNDHMHDEYVMDYISVSSAISAHEDAMASAQEELAESQAVARANPIEAVGFA